MKILFAAQENAWGGFLGMLQEEIPEHQCEATGGFHVPSLRGVDVLIPTMCRVDEGLLAQNDRLRLIQQCGSGLEGVDINAARVRNIWVANVPTNVSGNADSVAELGIYFMIGLSRNVWQMAKSFKEQRMGVPQGRALYNQTVGIIGLGGIGRALCKRLQPFGARIIGIKQHDPEKAKKELNLEWVGRSEDLNKLLEMSDYVILALPMTNENYNFIDHAAFLAMKKGAFLINLARGGLIDRKALEDALATGKIAGAGLDVFWNEPPDPNDPIFRYNIMVTPHIAGCTGASVRGNVKAVAENIRRVATGRLPLYLK